MSGEQAFIRDVIDGKDLVLYQSTRLDDPLFMDGMLNDFGVQHFHVGVGQHPTKPRFKERTDPVLFAMLRNNDLYCIGFYRHPPHDPHAWSKQEVLEILYDNWPALLEPFVVKGVLQLSQSYTDEEIGKLRKSGVNVFTQRADGTIHMAPGGGATTAKGSFKNVWSKMKLFQICADLEKKARDWVSQNFPNSPPDAVSLRTAGSALVIETSHGTRVPVSDFVIPEI